MKLRTLRRSPWAYSRLCFSLYGSKALMLLGSLLFLGALTYGIWSFLDPLNLQTELLAEKNADLQISNSVQTVGFGVFGFLLMTFGGALNSVLADWLSGLLFGARQRDHAADLDRTYQDLNKVAEISGDGARLLFFIDDLDRCTPDRVAQFVESVHSLTTAGCVTIVACDEEYVAAALNARHREIISHHHESDNFGRQFLEKIVQIGYRPPLLNKEGIQELKLSDPEARKRLEQARANEESRLSEGKISQSQDNAELSDELAQSNEPNGQKSAPQAIDETLLSDVLEELLMDYVEPLGLTPRTLKSVYNTVGLYLRIAGRLGRVDVRSRKEAERLAAFIFADRLDRKWLDHYRLADAPAPWLEGAFAGRDDIQMRLRDALGAPGEFDELYKLTGRQPRKPKSQ